MSAGNSSRQPGTVLGFDYGSHRIGVAVGQQVTGTATSLVTLAATDGQPNWQSVADLVAEWKPLALIVGIPYQLDGTRSLTTEAAERFARRMRGRFELPVYQVDERLSSHAAEEFLSDRRPSGERGRYNKGEIDKVAARIILQDWLDQQG